MGLGVGNGFVRYFCQFGAEGLQAVEVFDGSAVEALGLGLVAEEEFPALGMLGEVKEALGEGEVLFLGAGHLEVGIAVGRVEEIDGLGVAGVVKAGGKHAAFEAGGAQQVELGDGDALDGAEFLGVDGAVDGDEVGAEFADVVEAFEDGDGEIGSSEAVFAGVLGRSGFAFGGARTGGAEGIGPVRGKLLGRIFFGHPGLRFSIGGRGSLKIRARGCWEERR